MPFFEFDVSEYIPSPKGKGREISGGGTFRISEGRLLVAMVRSMLSVRAPWAIRNYLAAQIIPALHFFTERHSAPYFLMAHANLDHLRDFSFTSRVGEMAQGISYAYWAFDRKAHVCDFVEWSRARTPGVHLQSRPDFVVSPYNAPVLYVAEAKGTNDALPHVQMRKALRQAKRTGHPSIANSYGTVVTFARGHLPAQIHIQDPVRGGIASPEERHDVFRRHYASWYELAGNNAMAARLRPEGTHILGDRENNHLVRQTLLSALGLERAEFTVNPIVEKAIESFGFYEEGSWREGLSLDSELTDDRLTFPDGTVINGR
jgi:hypothetical protein